jgi:membrane-bound lytic murein transglycosylase A
MIRRGAIAIGVALAISACATTPAPRTETIPPRTQPSQPTPPSVAVAEGPLFTLRAVAFDTLPGWQTHDPRAALSAFRASCRALANRGDDQALGRLAPYGGTVGDWRGVCAAADIAADARAFFEFYFTPHEVVARSDITNPWCRRGVRLRQALKNRSLHVRPIWWALTCRNSTPPPIYRNRLPMM